MMRDYHNYHWLIGNTPQGIAQITKKIELIFSTLDRYKPARSLSSSLFAPAVALTTEDLKLKWLLRSLFSLILAPIKTIPQLMERLEQCQYERSFSLYLLELTHGTHGKIGIRHPSQFTPQIRDKTDSINEFFKGFSQKILAQLQQRHGHRFSAYLLDGTHSNTESSHPPRFASKITDETGHNNHFFESLSSHIPALDKITKQLDKRRKKNNEKEPHAGSVEREETLKSRQAKVAHKVETLKEKFLQMSQWDEFLERMVLASGHAFSFNTLQHYLNDSQIETLAGIRLLFERSLQDILHHANPDIIAMLIMRLVLQFEKLPDDADESTVVDDYGALLLASLQPIEKLAQRELCKQLMRGVKSVSNTQYSAAAAAGTSIDMPMSSSDEYMDSGFNSMASSTDNPSAMTLSALLSADDDNPWDSPTARF